MDLEELLSEFEGHLRNQGRSEGTIRGYLSDIHHFARWLHDTVGEEFSPENVAPIDVRSYRGHLQTVKGFAPATVNRRIQSLRSFFRWARADGRVKENPAADAKTVPTTRQQFSPKALNEQQRHRFLRTIQDGRYGRHSKRDYAIFQLMLQAGLRISEVAALRHGDLEIRPRSGQVRVREGKGRKERSAPLNSTARRAIREYLEIRVPMPGEDHVFLSQQGKAISVRTIRRAFEVYARQAGLDGEGISPHTLRHTFATEYLQENPGALVELAALLGHSDLNTTAIYTQPSFEDVARKLEDSSLNIDR